jgi:hypothetical protein
MLAWGNDPDDRLIQAIERAKPVRMGGYDEEAIEDQTEESINAIRRAPAGVLNTQSEYGDWHRPYDLVWYLFDIGYDVDSRIKDALFDREDFNPNAKGRLGVSLLKHTMWNLDRFSTKTLLTDFTDELDIPEDELNSYIARAKAILDEQRRWRKPEEELDEWEEIVELLEERKRAFEEAREAEQEARRRDAEDEEQDRRMAEEEAARLSEADIARVANEPVAPEEGVENPPGAEEEPGKDVPKGGKRKTRKGKTKKRRTRRAKKRITRKKK